MEKLQLQLPTKEKLQFFLFFVLLSSIFWTITKLSNTYQSQQSFEIYFSDIPDHILLDEDINTINITLTSTGFQMLRYGIFNKKIIFPFSAVQQNGNNGSIELQNQSFEIQKQLYDNTVINSLDSKSVSFNYFKLKRKRLPLVINENISFRPGYLLEDDLKLTPDSIWVTGSDSILDTLKYINIEAFTAQDVFKDITEDLNIEPISGLRYSKQKTHLSAAVSRFSEISFEIDIQIENLPDNTRVKLFPQRVNVILITKLKELGDYQPDDFIIACDYLSMINPKSKAVPLYPLKIPLGIKKIIWTPETVDFLIRQ